MAQTKIGIAARNPTDKISVLDIQGDITGFAEEPLMANYNTVSSSGVDTIVLNLAGLESINSFGVGLLIALLVRVRHQKQRLLAYGLSERHWEVFELTRLSEAIDLYADEAEALRSIGQ
jgi:anti-sigma B factor antagonist